MKLACWNVNSIRARRERLLAWLGKEQPDVLCLQETKVQDDDFPFGVLKEAGYEAATFGQKTYNGVAILSRTQLADVRLGLDDEVDDPQARLISASVRGVRVVSCYVPNGGEVGSDKYTYKLAWLERLHAYLERTAKKDDALIVCGDFNVAPRPCDVAHPEAWKDTVLCHPSAREALAKLGAWGLCDVFAEQHKEGGLFSWWDYRSLSFPRGDGLRIDLVLATRSVAGECQSCRIDRDERKGKLPSDHAPVIVELGQS